MNSAGDCDGCHNNGGEYTATGNPQQLPTTAGGPYTGATSITPTNPPATVNAAGYLAGGHNFGSSSHEVIARNLTPDFATGQLLLGGTDRTSVHQSAQDRP